MAESCAGLPLREIGSQKDLDAFLASAAYREYTVYVQRVGDACVGRTCPAPSDVPPCFAGARWAAALLGAMEAAVNDHPPQPMGVSRFGNPAFRTWLDAVRPMVEAAHAQYFVQESRRLSLELFGGDAAAAAREAASYLVNALGNRQRIDYGTGHEAHCVAWLLVLDRVGVFTPCDPEAEGGASETQTKLPCLESVDAPKPGAQSAAAGNGGESNLPDQEPTIQLEAVKPTGLRENTETHARPPVPLFSADEGTGTATPTTPAHTRDSVVGLAVFPAYVSLMRALQRTYWLEPAGSHGVWGLDDYHFVPFLWGAAQLVGHPHVRPSSVREDPAEADLGAARVSALSADYMYLGAVDAVRRAKGRGLAHHSPMLSDISAVRSWAKVYAGLGKMYRAEVLGKLPIMQHFLFGRVLSFRGSLGAERSADHAHAGPRGDCCGNPLPSAYAAPSSSGGGSPARRMPPPSACRHRPFPTVPFD